MSSIEIKDYLDRAASRNGYVRQSFEDRKLPNDYSDVCVMPLFADIRHTFTASSMLLKRYREEMKGSKYFILVSWPGHRTLFPYVDEFWSPGDAELTRKLWSAATGFENKSDSYTVAVQNLNESVREVVKPTILAQFHNNGLTQVYWDRFRNLRAFLPQVSSTAVLGKDFNREINNRAGFKVVVMPTTMMDCWKMGRVTRIAVPKDFWVQLVKSMKESGFVPVVVKTFHTFDISQETVDDAVHVEESDLGKILAAIRACGCLLDVCNGTSRFAIAARTPYLCVDERSRYFNTKDYEVDDLCGPLVPREYIYSFSTVCQMPPSFWDATVFRHIMMKLQDFLPGLDRDRWPTTNETNQIVPYDSVRKLKRRRLGTKLLKIIRD